ncbi:MAG: HAD family hydrolase [Planctomycetota bacterium]|jgi:putative hydrolase of the HAD superfamily
MASRSPIQAVVFDLDDTLYPERLYVHSGYEMIGRQLAGRTQSGEPLSEWLWQRFCAGRSDGAFDAVNEQFDLGLSAWDIAELVTLYRQHSPTIEPFEEVPDMLERLGKRFRLGLLSDGFLPGQQLKLQALRLQPYFRSIVFTEELGREFWKPAPEGFKLIARRLDVDHSACCYVGDNPAKDFVAPNRLGWRTIQLLWPGQVHADKAAPSGGKPRTVVASLSELMGALE